MKLYVASSKRITKYTLPIKLEEFFSVEYQPDNTREKYPITIISNETGKWYLKSNGSVDIVSKDSVIDEAELIEYRCYFAKLIGIDGYTIIYAMPDYEAELYSLDYKPLNKITIGSNSDANIYFNHPLIEKEHAVITKEDDGYSIKASDNARIMMFINDKQAKYKKLKYGDIIFINGLRIIWLPNSFKINNPGKQILVKGIEPYLVKGETNNAGTTPVSDEEASKELYREDDYFYHIPKIEEVIEEKTIVIDQPPSGEKGGELPAIFSIGASLTMLASSFVMGYSLYNNLRSGKTIMDCLGQIVMLVAMLISSLILPRLLSLYTKRLKKKREKYRQHKYKKYLADKTKEIEDEIALEEKILNENNDDTAKCIEVVSKVIKSNIWNREIVDDDFLNISLGVGDIPIKFNIQSPEEHFTLDEDNLFTDVLKVVEDHKYLHNVPIMFDFRTNNISSMIFNCSYRNDYVNEVMLKFATFHSGSDLKIIILTDKANESYWSYAKILPHCWSEDKSLRFFASSLEEANEISSFLDGEFKNRKEEAANSKDENADKKDIYKNYSPYYLIITDNYLNYKNLQIILDILKEKNNLGFSILTMADSMKYLPNRCANFIEISDTNSCILTKKVDSKSQIKFRNSDFQNIDMEGLCTKLANIPLMPKDGLKELPTSLSFLEMFKVSKIEQLNILNRWQTNNPVTSLSTVIGVHSDLEPFKLDLHEKFHGPHGLIAGSTGSGKSEFIITYILSLAINYHPYEVQFVLIDYKGGGLAGAFLNKETGVKLPHLVGTITNLDTSEMNRTLVSINSELKRRQRVFNATKDALGESTIDIYKYQRLYREGKVKEPMAHLFIISDEFAELKAQQPDFMDELISTARIGRSLGVHLILATQKPSGVVNDQIWSNSKFKVCLKVQDRSDSMEMLKKPDAASIKNAGRFYLQIGYDDYFDIGQSGWGGAKYVPSNKIVKKLDESIGFVNNTGYVIKSIDDEEKEKETTVDLGDQLTNIVKYIYNLGVKNNLKTNNLWLDKIPEYIFVEQLKQKYGYKAMPYVINPIIGEYDSPASQYQGLLTLDLTNKGNTLIYGQSGSGKENLLCTLIWSIITTHTPEEVNIYVIDCGAEMLKMFYRIPHVGDVVTREETEKVTGIFEKVYEEIERRKDLFADYAGSYVNYCANSGKKLPLITVIINNYDNFIENFAKLGEDVMSLYRECSKYGIVFVVTAVSTQAVRMRMSQYFDNFITLQLPKDEDYRNNFDVKRGLIPARIFGRGLVKLDNEFFEFQTAYFCNPNQMSQVIKMAADKLAPAYKVKADKIMVIPNSVGLNKVMPFLEGYMAMPIGYDIDKKEIVKYNFVSDRINMILSNEMSIHMELVYAVIRMLTTIPNTNIMIVDFVNAVDRSFDKVKVFKESFDEVLIAIAKQLKADKEAKTKNFYIFVAPGAMKFKLRDETKQIVNEMFSNANALENNFFIFADDYDDIKNLKVEEWYRTNVNTSNGIWMGDGVGSQMAINITNLTLEDRKLNYPCMAFMVNNGRKKNIKYIIDEDLVVGDTNEK